MRTFGEPAVETTALDWQRELGWFVVQDSDIAPGTPDSERDDCRTVTLERRLHEAYARINSRLPENAPETTDRSLVRPDTRRWRPAAAPFIDYWWPA